MRNNIYKNFIKRALDILISFCVLIVLSPVMLILIVVGAFAMHGNPLFFQERPGKNETIFKLIKFRTMSNAKDKDGNLLPDIDRLNTYGKILRKTSIDELPELINILKGDMSIVGPRPLAVSYLPYYNDEEKKRHSVRPGLTGLAQVNGRNVLNWPERFAYDISYVNNMSFKSDIKIIFQTVITVFRPKDVAVRGTTQIQDFNQFRIEQLEKERKLSN